MSQDELGHLLHTAIELLRARGANAAAARITSHQWLLADATNDFYDDFTVLYTRVGIPEYEELRQKATDPSSEADYREVASVLSEIGHHVRYIACYLDNTRIVSPIVSVAGDALTRLDSDEVRRVWLRALERQRDDPEGAITIARTLLETVCRHILEDLAITIDDSADLPQLYRRVAEALRLAPAQHSEDIFRRILGGCTSVVEGLGALRNRHSDAHGVGPRRVRPASRHAELAVNLAGSMSTFLVATWEVRRNEAT